MADWTAPFHAPKFTDDKFEKAKDAYNKKHGYAVTFPALSDIVLLNPFKPLTEKEKKLWTGDVKASEMPRHYLTVDEIDTWIRTKKGPAPRTRALNADEQKQYKADLKLQIPEARREEIRIEKQRKMNRFQGMLASPSPKILRSAGAVMTALDDTQDALSTLACIGMIAGAIAGATTAALLAMPVGLLAGAASLLNLLNPMSRLKGRKGKAKSGRAAKRDVEKSSDKNPFSKKGRAKLAKRIKKFRPSLSNAIEALQTTDGIFGIGISIGPIMGLAQDILAGVVRQWMGEKVVYKMSPPIVPAHVGTAQKALKAQAVLHGVPWKSDITEEVSSLIAANLTLQVIYPYLQDWNPLEQIEDVASLMIEAPRPTDPLTIEIIQESGYTLDDVCNWPQNGERWISLGELQELTAKQATENLTHFAQTNRNSPEAFLALEQAHDFALGSIEAIEGPGQVQVEYSHTERTVLIILDNGWQYPDDITEAQVEKFEDWIYTHEYMNTQPTAKDIWRYAEVFCGFRWAKSPDEER